MIGIKACARLATLSSINETVALALDTALGIIDFLSLSVSDASSVSINRTLGDTAQIILIMQLF